MTRDPKPSERGSIPIPSPAPRPLREQPVQVSTRQDLRAKLANRPSGGIVFATIYSLLLFGDNISLAGWAGMALIVASGVAATWLRDRTLPDTPAEDH